MIRVFRSAARALTRLPARPGPGGLVNGQRTPAVGPDVRGDDKAAIAQMMELVAAERAQRGTAAT